MSKLFNHLNSQTRATRFLPDFIGRLLVNAAGKVNVGFAAASFSFAAIISYKKIKHTCPSTAPAAHGNLSFIYAVLSYFHKRTLNLPAETSFFVSEKALRIPVVSVIRSAALA